MGKLKPVLALKLVMIWGTDPSKRGQKYWRYTVNELGMEDVAAQLDWIDHVKRAELAPSPERSRNLASDLNGSLDLPNDGTFLGRWAECGAIWGA